MGIDVPFLNGDFNALSESTKAEIETAFNEAVEIKAQELAEEKIFEAVANEKIRLKEEFESEKEEYAANRVFEVLKKEKENFEMELKHIKEAYESRLNEGVYDEEKVAEVLAQEIIKIREEYEAAKDAYAEEKIAQERIKLTEEFEEAKEELTDFMVEKMDEFLNKQLETFIENVSEKLDSVIVNEKSEAMLNIFNSMVESTGFDVIKLYESSLGQLNNGGENLTKKYEALSEKYANVKNELEELKIQNIINEKANGLNLVSAEKFKVLAGLVEKDENFENKLDEIVESLKTYGDSNNFRSNHRINESNINDSNFIVKHVKDNGNYSNRDVSDIDASKF